jgi:CheY-like chemotaxis protein
MSRLLKILIIDDSDDDALLIFRQLRKEHYEPFSERVDTEPALVTALGKHKWDMALCDYRMPGLECLRALKLVKNYNPNLPFILISAYLTDSLSEEILKAGADDYVSKNNLPNLIPVIEKELVKAKIRIKRKQLKQTMFPSARADAPLTYPFQTNDRVL